MQSGLSRRPCCHWQVAFSVILLGILSRLPPQCHKTGDSFLIGCIIVFILFSVWKSVEVWRGTLLCVPKGYLLRSLRPDPILATLIEGWRRNVFTAIHALFTEHTQTVRHRAGVNITTAGGQWEQLLLPNTYPGLCRGGGGSPTYPEQVVTVLTSLYPGRNYYTCLQRDTISWYNTPIHMYLHVVGDSKCDKYGTCKSKSDTYGIYKSESDRYGIGKSKPDRYGICESKSDRCGICKSGVHHNRPWYGDLMLQPPPPPPRQENTKMAAE